MTQPEWADQIISEACALKGRRVPKVKWLRRSSQYSSGVTFYRKHKGFRIRVGLGTDELDGKQVLCHELAHYLGKPKWHHNKRFWLILKELLIHFDLYLDEYKSREYNYKKKAQLYL